MLWSSAVNTDGMDVYMVGLGEDMIYECFKTYRDVGIYQDNNPDLRLHTLIIDPPPGPGIHLGYYGYYAVFLPKKETAAYQLEILNKNIGPLLEMFAIYIAGEMGEQDESSEADVL